MSVKIRLDDVVSDLKNCLAATNKPTLSLPDLLPSVEDLTVLKTLVDSLLELHDFYISFLLSCKYFGEPLSEELVEAMKKAGIDPTVEAKKPETRPGPNFGVSSALLDKFDR